MLGGVGRFFVNVLMMSVGRVVNCVKFVWIL